MIKYVSKVTLFSSFEKRAGVGVPGSLDSSGESCARIERVMNTIMSV
jgi:hypothetical protein